MNCYEILEVSQNASPEVIKAAYKSLMQRYHPDKNPGNVEIAAHASNVVQAYEVLSDANLRAAHDIELKQQAGSLLVNRVKSMATKVSSVAHDLQFAKESQSWLMWLLVVLLIVLCLYALAQLRNMPIGDYLSTGQESHRKVVSEGIEVLPRTIPAYISDLTIDLKDPDRSAEGTAHVLNIPVLGVSVGAVDANKVLRYIDNNKKLIRQKLEERLGDAKYEALIKPDGEQYLQDLVLDSIGDTPSANQYRADPLNSAETGQYGVVDVWFPRSFSVH